MPEAARETSAARSSWTGSQRLMPSGTASAIPWAARASTRVR
jgi:hypothetical protein